MQTSSLKRRCCKATYYPIQARWRRLKGIFESRIVRTILLTQMLEYYRQKAADHGFKFEHDPSREKLPRDFDGSDWRYFRGKPGPAPAFWDYACHMACHWVVDACLVVATQAEPGQSWRVVSSQKHSTVWNGDERSPVLFDVNFLAIGVPAPQALALALDKGRISSPGRFLRTPGWVAHYSLA